MFSDYLLTGWRMSHNWLNYTFVSLITLGTDRVQNSASHGCNSIVAVGTYFFAKKLLSKGCHVFANSAVVAWQRALFIESLLKNWFVCYNDNNNSNRNNNNNNNNNNNSVKFNCSFLPANPTAQGPITNWARVKGWNKHKVQNKAVYNIWVMIMIRH
jgi:hypothetical protein